MKNRFEKNTKFLGTIGMNTRLVLSLLPEPKENIATDTLRYLSHLFSTQIIYVYSISS